MTAVTWADIRAGDIVRLKGDDWTVTRNTIGFTECILTIEREGRVVGPRTVGKAAEVERVELNPLRSMLENGGDTVKSLETLGEMVRAAEGDLPAAEALAAVQLGAVVIGRKDGAQPWRVVGVDETMIHGHLYNFHGIDVVAVGSAAEAMALHLADHAAAVKAGSFAEHEHVS